jgi:hypothetical protein
MHYIAEGTIKLSEQTKNIEEIINTVSDIADQSNIFPSTRPLKLQRPASTAGAFRWWRRKSNPWPTSPRTPPTRSDHFRRYSESDIGRGHGDGARH